MVQLNFHDVENNPIGILNWFAVHPTSMNKTNRLISGDNKGAASLMMEKLMCPSQLAGRHPLSCYHYKQHISTRPVFVCCCFCLEQPWGCVAKHKRTSL